MASATEFQTEVNNEVLDCHVARGAGFFIGSCASCRAMVRRTTASDHRCLYPIALTAVASDEAIVGWKWDGQSLAEPLEETRRLALLQVDDAAEITRRKNLPPGTGQSLTYERKRNEALRLQNDGNPDESNYPFLAASKGIDGATIADVASAVLQQSNALTVRFANIEKIRLTAKKDIRAASSISEINSITAAVVWPNGNGH